jgi:hypothetical protein
VLFLATEGLVEVNSGHAGCEKPRLDLLVSQLRRSGGPHSIAEGEQFTLTLPHFSLGRLVVTLRRLAKGRGR